MPPCWPALPTAGAGAAAPAALPGNWAWEMPAYLTGALNVAIIKEGEEWKKSRALKAFRKAMNIALGPS